MNKILTFIFLTLSFSLTAQSVERYNFSHRTEAYRSIESSGTNIAEGLTWDDELFLMPLEFEMSLFGKSVETVVGVTNGWILHPDGLMSDFPESLCFLFADFADLGLNSSTREPESPIYIYTTGVAGEKVAILEYKNAGFYKEDPTIRDYVNFQFKFFEKDNAIEMHFGPSEVINLQEIFGPFPGPFIGITYNTSFDTITEEIELDTFLSIKGDQNNFSAIHSNTKTNIFTPDIYFTGWPKENQVFRFVPGMLIANRDISKDEFKVFPNPYHEKFIFQSTSPISNTEVLQLKNSLGQNIKIEIQKISDRLIEIKTDAQLPSGVYMLTLSSQNGVVSKSVVKR